MKFALNITKFINTESKHVYWFSHQGAAFNNLALKSEHYGPI